MIDSEMEDITDPVKNANEQQNNESSNQNGRNTTKEVEEIDYSEYSSDECDSENETRVKKKKSEKLGVFSDDFKFEEQDQDPWATYFHSNAVKKNFIKGGADKLIVVKEPTNKNSEVKELIDIGNSDMDSADSDDDLIEGSKKAVDRLKQNEREKRRKQKKNLKRENEEDEEQIDMVNAPVDEAITFQEMNLSRNLLKAIEYMDFDKPTPIQAAAIPVALLGKDICGCASTGTGKTAAFMLPILERLLFKPLNDSATRVLVLVPTRELGVQVFEVSKNLARYSNIDIALSVGGLDLRSQEATLRTSPDIVIATPGRLIDHLKNTMSFSLDRIEILVVDEADRMLDEYFAEQMKEIIDQCNRSRQTLLFSATMSTAVKDLVAVSLKDPVKIFVNSNKTVAQNLKQEFIRIKSDEEKMRDSVLAYLVCRTFHTQCIVFIQTKLLCHRMYTLLGLFNVSVGELHGNLSQLQRLETLEKFKLGEIGVLLCTDLAARGLDIPHVKTVINFTLPATYQNYVHRVGRTARAGLCGRSISLVGEKEYKTLKLIKKESKTVVYERQPNKKILLKLKNKIESLQDEINDIHRKEKEEREIRGIENSLNGMQKKINANPEDIKKREWFQTHKERLAEKKRQLIVKPEKKSKKQKKKPKPDISPSEQRILREVEIAQSVAKRANKGIKVKTPFGEHVDKEPVKVKKNKNSMFAKELTRTDRRSVKKYRSESFDEKKMNFQKKNPGKKFKPRKK